MGRDAKIIQRGQNSQANDLSVPPGTMLQSVNLDYDRDGVASRRPGMMNLFSGLPRFSMGGSINDPTHGENRDVYSTFADAHMFHLNNEVMFAYDEVPVTGNSGAGANSWASMPVNLSHPYSFLGVWLPAGGVFKTGYSVSRIGRLLSIAQNDNASNVALGGAFNWQVPQPQGTTPSFVGAIGNDASTASLTRLQTGFDFVGIGASFYFSDSTAIRTIDGTGAPLLAGSFTLSGYTDATGAAARFSGASWMATDGTNIFVADNTNAIRKVTTGGVVTTLAGSITAGDTDGTGGAGGTARFRGISGLAYSGGVLYVAEGGAHRIRQVNTSTGATSIFAGALTPTPGFVDAPSITARFNTPTGIEVIGTSLYVGDSGNNAIRQIVISTANVTSYFKNADYAPTTGMVSGVYGALPSVTVRGQVTFTSDGSALGFFGSSYSNGTYLSVECGAASSSTDIGLVPVNGNAVYGTGSEGVFHIARCSSLTPNATAGSLKLDQWGINSTRNQKVRCADTTSGVVFNSMERPRIVDAYTRLNQADPFPRFRQLGLDWPEAPSITTGAGTTFANNTAVAYRTLCALKLPNGRIAFGAVSERVIAINTSGSSCVFSITAYPSPGMPWDGMPFVQVYRTKTVANTVDPGDQQFLCYEAPITYGQGVVFNDQLPDALLGAELYTNQTQYGLASNSLPPPFYANELANFQNQVTFADFVGTAFCRVTCLGVTGLSAGTSTITITSTAPNIGAADLSWSKTLTAQTTTNPLTNTFGIGTGGTADQNAVQTARNIVRVINRSPDCFLFRAQYDESNPGSLIIYSTYPGRGPNITQDDGSGNMTLTQCSVGFSTNTTNVFTAAEQQPSVRTQNVAYYADPSDPDSCPAINQSTVGPQQEAIVRLLPISDSLLVVKTKTVWRFDPTFTPLIYDTALSCNQPDSFARLNNNWIGLFTRGFVSLGASQSTAVGRPIDHDVQARYNSQSVVSSPLYGNISNAAASDRQGKYVCHYNGITYSYSAYSDSWGTIQQTGLGAPHVFWGCFRDLFVGVQLSGSNGLFWQIGAANASVFDVPNIAGYNAQFADGVAYGTLTVSGGIGAFSQNTNMSPGNLSNLATQAGALLTNAAFGAKNYVLTNINTGIGSFLTFNQPLADGTYANTKLYLPIGIGALYAPSVNPGTNNRFGDVVVTIEHSTSGIMYGNFYNRKDYYQFVGLAGLSGYPSPSGTYQPPTLPIAPAIVASGIFRQASITVPAGALDWATTQPTVLGGPGVFASPPYIYHNTVRLVVPAERSVDQQVVVQISECSAMNPLAIKAVVVDGDSTDNSKVKQ